jgi:hypothetical protein
VEYAYGEVTGKQKDDEGDESRGLEEASVWVGWSAGMYSNDCAMRMKTLNQRAMTEVTT